MQYTVLYSPGGGMLSACYGQFDSQKDAQAYIDLIKRGPRKPHGVNDSKTVQWAGTFSIILAQGNVIRPA